MALTLADIATLFTQYGTAQYSGEPVTQLEHALQTAQLAENAGAGDELITAALLHDLGHLLNDQGESPTLRGVDDTHQYFALPFLHGVFSDRVLCVIQWHVDAKRYLCAVQPDYQAGLSVDSQHSLELQGGIFSADEAQRFIAQIHAGDTVRLRLWDDKAKTANHITPSLAHYLGYAERCMVN